MYSTASSPSSSVTPSQLIDEILNTNANKPDFDLSGLIAQIDGLLAVYDTQLKKKNPIRYKLAEHPSAAEPSSFADLKLIVNEIKEVLNAIGNVHWSAKGFVVVGAALKVAGIIVNKEEKCLWLFKSMNDLSKAILQLQDIPGLEMEWQIELNESIHLIVKGAILCCSEKERKVFERVFKAITDRQGLQQLNRNIDNMCKMLLSYFPPIPTNQDADLQCQMELGDSSTSTAERDTENAFDGTVSQASISSSTLMKKKPYDVFINHRGRDTKHKLASTIYYTLDLVGLRAFLDVEELKFGDFLPMEIEEAISSASVHIAIFSKNYAQSPSCLAELSFMLNTRTEILPVYYNVQPSDLRRVAQGEGLYARAFSKYEKKGKYSSNLLDEWKTALTRVSNIHGYILNSDDDDEGRLLKIITEIVLRQMKREVSRVHQDLRSLQVEAYDPKRVGLGIYHHEMSPYWSDMGEEKVKALCTTTKRLKDITVDELVAEIGDLKIKNCYRDSRGSFSEEVFAWNFAMDTCFILEFFRSLYWFSDHTIEKEIMTDIFKLENQIPLFILLRILELEFHPPEKAISKLANMLCMHPEIAILPFSLKSKELKIVQAEVEANIKEGACHLLHLLSKTIEAFLQPSDIPTCDTGMDTYVDIVNDWTNFMSVVVDRDADIVHEFLIRFKPSKDGQVRFKKGWLGSGVLYLPQIYLFEETEPLLWNLIAFAVRSENIIDHFMFFMKCIIHLNSKSVALLKKVHIIISERSDEELYTMFHNLSNVLSQSCGPFENVLSLVKEHYNSPINKWMLWFTCLVSRFAIIGLCQTFLFAISGWVNIHYVLVPVLAVNLFLGFRLRQAKILLIGMPFATIRFCVAFLFAISGWVGKDFALGSRLAVNLFLFLGLKLRLAKIRLPEIPHKPKTS